MPEPVLPFGPAGGGPSGPQRRPAVPRPGTGEKYSPDPGSSWPELLRSALLRFGPLRSGLPWPGSPGRHPGLLLGRQRVGALPATSAYMVAAVAILMIFGTVMTILYVNALDDLEYQSEQTDYWQSEYYECRS